MYKKLKNYIFHRKIGNKFEQAAQIVLFVLSENSF